MMLRQTPPCIRCSKNRCQYKKNGFTCKDICVCSDNGEQCENVLDDDSDDEINNEENDDVDYVLTEHINESLLEEKEDLVLIMREIVTLN